MKKVLIICLALLTFSLQAQPGNNGGKQRGERKMNYKIHIINAFY